MKGNLRFISARPISDMRLTHVHGSLVSIVASSLFALSHYWCVAHSTCSARRIQKIQDDLDYLYLLLTSKQKFWHSIDTTFNLMSTKASYQPDGWPCRGWRLCWSLGTPVDGKGWTLVGSGGKKTAAVGREISGSPGKSIKGRKKPGQFDIIPWSEATQACRPMGDNFHVTSLLYLAFLYHHILCTVRLFQMFCKLFYESSPCQPLFAWAAAQLQFRPGSLWNNDEIISKTFGTTWRPRLYSTRPDSCSCSQTPLSSLHGPESSTWSDEPVRSGWPATWRRCRNPMYVM